MLSRMAHTPFVLLFLILQAEQLLHPVNSLKNIAFKKIPLAIFLLLLYCEQLDRKMQVDRKNCLKWKIPILWHLVSMPLWPEEMSEGKHSNAGTIAFSPGFIPMMIPDVALG